MIKPKMDQLLPNAVAPGKCELEAYWRTVARHALPYLARRPLRLVRHADGLIFYHTGPLPPVPASVHTLGYRKADGTPGLRVWIDDLAGLLGLVDMQVVEVHPWGATLDDIEHPDILVFNLKPGERVEWDFVVDSALRLHHLLADEGLDAWPKTTGDDSLHVMAPVSRRLAWNAARDLARRISKRLEATDPEKYTTSARAARAGTILIDYLRNVKNGSSIGPYSPRALPGFPVAAPVVWSDLERGIRPENFRMDRPPPLNLAKYKSRKPGFLKHWKVPADTFFEPLDPDELDAAEGNDTDEFGITMPPRR